MCHTALFLFGLLTRPYVDAALLAESAEKYQIELFGPTRLNPSWQTCEGGYDSTRFQIDWDKKIAICQEEN
jgi:hypothetical protein